MTTQTNKPRVTNTGVTIDQARELADLNKLLQGHVSRMMTAVRNEMLKITAQLIRTHTDQHPVRADEYMDWAEHPNDYAGVASPQTPWGSDSTWTTIDSMRVGGYMWDIELSKWYRITAIIKNGLDGGWALTLTDDNAHADQYGATFPQDHRGTWYYDPLDAPELNTLPDSRIVAPLNLSHIVPGGPETELIPVSNLRPGMYLHYTNDLHNSYAPKSWVPIAEMHMHDEYVTLRMATDDIEWNYPLDALLYVIESQSHSPDVSTSPQEAENTPSGLQIAHDHVSSTTGPQNALSVDLPGMSDDQLDLLRAEVEGEQATRTVAALTNDELRSLTNEQLHLLIQRIESLQAYRRTRV